LDEKGQIGARRWRRGGDEDGRRMTNRDKEVERGNRIWERRWGSDSKRVT
jgi:hypothetical protein